MQEVPQGHALHEPGLIEGEQRARADRLEAPALAGHRRHVDGGEAGAGDIREGGSTGRRLDLIQEQRGVLHPFGRILAGLRDEIPRAFRVEFDPSFRKKDAVENAPGPTVGRIHGKITHGHHAESRPKRLGIGDARENIDGLEAQLVDTNPAGKVGPHHVRGGRAKSGEGTALVVGRIVELNGGLKHSREREIEYGLHPDAGEGVPRGLRHAQEHRGSLLQHFGEGERVKLGLEQVGSIRGGGHHGVIPPTSGGLRQGA